MATVEVAGVELIGVPFDGYGRAGNQARAAAALRAAGLSAAVGTVTRDDDIALPAGDPTRGPTGLLNEPALVAMTDALSERVGAALAAGRFPVVFGGDCAMLLGVVAGLRELSGHAIGLVFVDGHEDTMPLDVSEDGEAANAEIGLLLGITGRLLTGPLARALSALTREQLVVLGPRDEGWRRQFNVGSLAGYGVWLAPRADTAAAPADTGRRAVHALNRESWWLHIDLDVLDPLVFSSQGLPGVADEPGGLTWEQLTALAAAMLDDGGCVGCSLAIYDPDQDADGADAARIVEFVHDVLGAGTAVPARG
jgi:arginase